MKLEIIEIILIIITLIYNIKSKNRIALNIILILSTIIFTFIFELGALPFHANDEIKKGIYHCSISGISFIIISVIEIIASIIFIIKKEKLSNMNFSKLMKYFLGILIIIASVIWFYSIYVDTGNGGILIKQYTDRELLHDRLNSYLEGLPSLILEVNLFITLIIGNHKKIDKKEDEKING